MGREVFSPTPHHALTVPPLPHCCQREFHSHTQAHTWHQNPIANAISRQNFKLFLSRPTGPVNPKLNPWHTQQTVRVQLQQLLDHSLAPSTRGTYSTGFNHFIRSCSHCNHTTACLQAQHYLLCSFTQQEVSTIDYSGLHCSHQSCPSGVCPTRPNASECSAHPHTANNTEELPASSEKTTETYLLKWIL